MFDSENSTDNCKTLKISIGTIIKNPEMLKFVPDQLETKKTCKNAIKKLLFVTRHVSDRYKTQEMCDKNGGILKFAPDCYKNQ